MRWISLLGYLWFVGGVVSSASHDWKHSCLNGKNPAFMSVRQYMKEFAAGPCSPVVLLPGVLASVLMVEIVDCEALRYSDIGTFTSCGWDNCNSGQPGAPLSEYQIWIPAVGSPMTILSSNEMNKDCFAGLVQVAFSKGKDFVPIDKPGVRVRVKGQSRGTKLSSKCGAEGVEFFIPGVPNPESTEYFNAMINRLEDMGYKSGLTYQAVPYDFRLSSGFDGASNSLPAVMDLLRRFANKRVVIAAHSMGNMKAAYALWNMSQDQKDETVMTFLSIAPPFSGSAKPLSYTTCGSNEFFFPLDLGIDMKTWKILASSFPSIFELLPPPTFTSQRDQAWMQNVINRLKYENGTSTDPVFDFLPSKDQTCYPSFNQSKCRSGLEEYDHWASFIGLRIDNSNMKEFITNHSFCNLTQDMYSLFDQRFETLPNIGVPSIFVYSYVVPTEGKYVFNQDPRVTWSLDKFCSSKNLTWDPWAGDETVPSVSVMLAGLKWAMEFKQKQPGAKPVKFLDVCSVINVKRTPYDGQTAAGVREMTGVEYQGLPCDCSQGKYKHCTHIGMLHNKELVDYLSTTVYTNDVQPVSDMVSKMSDLELSVFHSECRILAVVKDRLLGDSRGGMDV